METVEGASKGQAPRIRPAIACRARFRSNRGQHLAGRAVVDPLGRQQHCEWAGITVVAHATLRRYAASRTVGANR
jgi:hypothetical protein